MKPRISVVLPTYNCAHYLPGVIHSIRMQEWPNLEIIVVDDGSTDNTMGVLRGFSGLDLRVITQENQGPAAARNTGIRAADGTWVAFQDADDLWLPGKLSLQMHALEKDPSCGFSYTDSLAREADGTVWIQRPLAHGSDILSSLLLGPQFAAGSVIVRRDLFPVVGFFDTRLRTAEDWDMWLRLAAAAPGVYVPHVLNFFRVSRDAGKYPMELFEKANLQVVERIFSPQGVLRYRPEIEPSRRRIFAWHYAVLAKSNLKRGRLRRFFELAMASINSHPTGGYYLARRWGQRRERPQLARNPEESLVLTR